MLRSEHTICSEASMPSAPKQACHLLRTEHTICSKNKKDMTTNNNKRQLSARLLAAALTICLYGCSGEITDGNTLPDGEYPMTFTAAVDGLMQTRATTDNTWEGGEEIAVRIDDEVKKYVAAMDNTLSVENDGTPWYWQNTTEKKAVSAWYPYNDTKLADNALTVKANQRDDGYQASDYLEAAETTVTFGSSANLIFKHRTAKVVVTLKAGNGVSAGDLNGATVRFLNLTGVEGGGTEVTPKFDNNTYSALLIPQQVQGEKFIQVTARGNTYYYTPTGSEADLKAGKKYPYEITVSKNGLAVAANGATAWTAAGSATDVTGKTPVPGYSASDLKIGDYYYSDGTWSDGGYRKYADNTTAMLPVMPVLTGADGKERTVIGIVYYVGDIKGDNYGLLDGKFPDGTHGLVVSLWDMPAPDDQNSFDMTWTYGGYEYVDDWLKNATWSGDVGRPDGFTSIQVDNKMQGYANTVALEEYNTYVEDSNNNKGQDLRVKPVKGLEKFRSAHPAPASSSGWYWPSVCELKQVCWGQGVTDQGTNGKDMLNAQIGKAGNGTTFAGVSYWSSTEYSNGSYIAWYVDFFYGDVYYFGNKDICPCRVRPLFAF